MKIAITFMFINNHYFLLHAAVECSSWPTDTKFGCTEGDDAWKQLDGDMDLSMTTSCETLCRKEGGKGCCYLKDEVGCYWRAGANSATGGTVSGISVNCNLAGI